MPPARAVFLFPSSGYNAHTSISPVERRYTFFECLNVKLYCRQEKACRRVLQAFIAYAVVCKRSMQPRKRCRRAPAASRRLFIRPSGRGCLRLSLRLFRLSALCPPVALLPARRDMRHLVNRSGGQAGRRVRRHAQQGRVRQGRFRLRLPLFAPFSVCFSPPVQESSAGKS